MKFVSTLLMFLGYMLVYAAVAASGKFATEPWAGLFADAYTEVGDPSVTSRDGSTAATVRKRKTAAARSRIDPSKNRTLPPR